MQKQTTGPLSNIVKNFRVVTAEHETKWGSLPSLGPVPLYSGTPMEPALGLWALQPKNLEQDRLIGKVFLPLEGKVFQNFLNCIQGGSHRPGKLRGQKKPRMTK